MSILLACTLFQLFYSLKCWFYLAHQKNALKNATQVMFVPWTWNWCRRSGIEKVAGGMEDGVRMSEDVCVYGATVTVARPRSCSLACPHLVCTVTPISHLIYFYICAPLWSGPITPAVSFPPVDLSCSARRSVLTWPGQVLSTSVINPAVCVAACLHDGLSWSAFVNVSAFKKGPLCVYLHGLCLCGFRFGRL